MMNWAMQLAWQMQASLEAQMGWHEEEDADWGYAASDITDINITGELARRSSEGLAVVENASVAADCLRSQLSNVKQTLEDVSETMRKVENFEMFQYIGCDDFEIRAASAMQEVHELLREQAAKEAPPLPKAAVRHLKKLQVHCQDVALLLCSRFLNQTLLRNKGVSPELLARLEAAFGHAALQDDDIWSRLGNAKYHVFTEDMHWGRRRHRGGRGTRLSDLAEEDGDAMSEPMRIRVPSWESR